MFHSITTLSIFFSLKDGKLAFLNIQQIFFLVDLFWACFDHFSMKQMYGLSPNLFFLSHYIYVRVPGIAG